MQQALMLAYSIMDFTIESGVGANYRRRYASLRRYARPQRDKPLDFPIYYVINLSAVLRLEGVRRTKFSSSDPNCFGQLHQPNVKLELSVIDDSIEMWLLRLAIL